MATNGLQPTDYRLLNTDINNLVDESAMDNYSSCIDRLLEVIDCYFPALTPSRNPVLSNLDSWNRSELAFLIREYSAFSNAAIHMFLEARIRNHWPALTNEIVRNMEEEMGVLTKNIPHLELMRYGYRVELGLETDGVRCSAMTAAFIDQMTELFCVRDNTYLAGVLLAFETTAVNEFRIVESMLRRYKELGHEEILPDSLTWQYIAGHVLPEGFGSTSDPEMDHYRGMVEAIGGSVDGGNLLPLVQGFLSICLELNSWWERLAFEAWQKAIHDKLAKTRRTPPELYGSLLAAFVHNQAAHQA